MCGERLVQSGATNLTTGETSRYYSNFEVSLSVVGVRVFDRLGDRRDYSMQSFGFHTN